MKIVAIALPVPYAAEPAMNPPIGLCSIAAYLRLHTDVEMEGVDFALHREDYAKLDYLRHIPLDGHIYAITCVTPQYRWLRQVVTHVRQKAPEALVVVGGPHATSCPEDCLEAGAHIAVRGDGEDVMMGLVTGRVVRGPGIYRKEDGVLFDGGVTYIRDLDAYPHQDLSLFGVDGYKRHIGGMRALSIMTSRGCPYSCSFCDKKAVGKRVRYRSVENVMAEVDEFVERYDVKAFVPRDDIFTLKKDRVLRFCEEFARRGLFWRCWARANTIDREMLEAMKTSNMTSITIGIESGDQNVLDIVDKSVSVEQNREALLLCREVGVPVRCALMYGNPGESRQSVESTIRFIEETQPGEWNLSIFTPIPGSRLWSHPEEYGVSFDRQWFKDNDYLPTHRLGDSGMGHLSVSVDGISDEELAANLKVLVEGLERVCPRRKVQDTIQTLRPDCV
jgi:radical SAM superfamily enzyme YgiQ (UPF0313 family)